MTATELKEGQIVKHYGHEFIATNVRQSPGRNAFGEIVWNYEGVCTNSSANDSIRNTGFNGGTYSWRASDGHSQKRNETPSTPGV
jgi:hypothetical protein